MMSQSVTTNLIQVLMTRDLNLLHSRLYKIHSHENVSSNSFTISLKTPRAMDRKNCCWKCVWLKVRFDTQSFFHLALVLISVGDFNFRKDQNALARSSVCLRPWLRSFLVACFGDWQEMWGVVSNAVQLSQNSTYRHSREGGNPAT